MRDNDKDRIMQYFEDHKDGGDGIHILLDVADELKLDLDYVEELVKELSEEGRAKYFPDYEFYE